MKLRDVVTVIGLFSMAACLDRKSTSVDGATFDALDVGEAPVFSGAGGSLGVDSVTGRDVGAIVDVSAVPDVPITPDSGIIDVSAGSGGARGTGGIATGQTGGSMGTGGSGGTGTGLGTGGTIGTGGAIGTGGTVGTGGTIGAGGATVGVDAPPALLANGSPCTTNAVCASTVCADGVCCGSDCSGCKACSQALTGQPNGICAMVLSGSDPHDTCAVETATNQCGNDGACDGAGACRKVGTSHLCSAATCVGSTFTPASFCDGKGTCTAVTAQSCGAFQCSATEGCRTTCTSQADCGSQSYCNTATGTCLPKIATGGACTQALACVSGACVDGVCCENTCTGGCKACALAKTGASDGLCRPVKVGTDPDNECGADGTPCGLDGMCDGVGACRYQTTGTPCGTASCTGEGMYTPRGQCNGSGTCLPGSPGRCPNNLLCASSTACTATCTDRSTTGCPSGYKCLGGTACAMAMIPCGSTSCPTANDGVCCQTRTVGTVGTTPWTYSCETYSSCSGSSSRYWSPLYCGSKADCPSGQVCCMTGTSCDGTGGPGGNATCTSDTSQCRAGTYNWGVQLCDPSLVPTECMSGTCQSDSCVRGTYVCK